MSKIELKEVAAKYREIALQMKNLEKQASPLKTELLDYAKTIGLEKALEIGGISIEPRVTVESNFKVNAITPDWLYRAQQAGIYVGFKIAPIPDEKRIGLLDEIDYKLVDKRSYAIRV